MRRRASRDEKAIASDWELGNNVLSGAALKKKITPEAITGIVMAFGVIFFFLHMREFPVNGGPK